MLIDIASTHITAFVAISATACEGSGMRRRKGGEGMNCSQNSTPAAKKVPCISQMCTASLFAARSNSAGTCHATITTLNSATATWAWPALTDIHHQGFAPGRMSDHGEHGEEEAPAAPFVHAGVQGRDRGAVPARGPVCWPGRAGL